jgi:hypothetical protein
LRNAFDSSDGCGDSSSLALVASALDFMRARMGDQVDFILWTG